MQTEQHINTRVVSIGSKACQLLLAALRIKIVMSHKICIFIILTQKTDTLFFAFDHTLLLPPNSHLVYDHILEISLTKCENICAAENLTVCVSFFVWYIMLHTVLTREITRPRIKFCDGKSFASLSSLYISFRFFSEIKVSSN